MLMYMHCHKKLNSSQYIAVAENIPYQVVRQPTMMMAPAAATTIKYKCSCATTLSNIHCLPKSDY